MSVERAGVLDAAINPLLTYRSIPNNTKQNEYKRVDPLTGF